MLPEHVNWAIRAILAGVIGLAVFEAVRHIHLFGISSFWLGAALGATTTILAWLGQTIDLTKKALETYKVWWEVKTDRRAEKEKSRLVQLANADEIKQFGQSPVERILNERYQKTGQYVLEPKRFVADSREEKLP